MATTNYLDKSGVAYLWQKITTADEKKVDKVDGYGLSTNDYTSDEKTKLANIEDGAEENVLEGVQIAGESLSPTNKIVNIPTMTGASSTTAGSVGLVPKPAMGEQGNFLRGDGTWAAETTYDVATETADGLMSAADKKTLDNLVNEGGETNLINSISVNSTALTIDDSKNVDIAVATGSSKGTISIGGSSVAVRGLDSMAYASTDDYSTTAAVQTMIDEALDDITGVDFKVVDKLPSSGEKGIIYLISNGGSSGNSYDEYIWLSDSSSFEKIGTTDVDLSDYVTEDDLVAITTDEIDAICV